MRLCESMTRSVSEKTEIYAPFLFDGKMAVFSDREANNGVPEKNVDWKCFRCTLMTFSLILFPFWPLFCYIGLGFCAQRSNRVEKMRNFSSIIQFRCD